MKSILVSFSLLLSATFFGQNESQKTIESIFDEINNKNIEALKTHLTSDFKYANYHGKTAEIILNKLINSVGKIKNFKLLHQEKSKFTYSINYENIGEKTAFFVLNNNQKISQLELVKVKTLSKDEIKITYNQNDVTVIPFQEKQNMIIVKATLNGIERNFILDTGSSYTILNSKYQKIEEGTGTMTDVNGVNQSKSDIIMADIDFYGTKIKQQKTVTSDISHLEKILETKIYGLIGYDFIKKYDIFFEYQKHKITLIKPDYFDNFAQKKHKKSIFKIKMRNHIPVISIKIGTLFYTMGIDSGASSNLMNINAFSDMKNDIKNISEEKLSGVSKEKKSVISGMLKTFYIEKVKYKKTNFVFNDVSHLNKNEKIKIDGLLGYYFLSEKPTVLSFKRNEIIVFK